MPAKSFRIRLDGFIVILKPLNLFPLTARHMNRIRFPGVGFLASGPYLMPRASARNACLTVIVPYAVLLCLLPRQILTPFQNDASYFPKALSPAGARTGRASRTSRPSPTPTPISRRSSRAFRRRT